jgi:hypothetical protein
VRHTDLDIDHIGILGPDIDALVVEYANIGFSIVGPAELTAVDVAGNTHSLGQQSAHIMFGKDYIELTAVSSKDPQHHLANYLKATPGIRLLILASNDIHTSREQCLSSNMQPGDVQRAAREITYGSPGHAQFTWFGLPAHDWPDVLVAFVQHESSDTVFQADAARHTNQASGLKRLLYVGNDLPTRFECLPVGSTHRIEPVSVADFQSATGFEYCESSPLAAAVIGSHDLAATENALVGSGVPVAKLANGVATQMQSGICLLFEPVELD